MKYYIAQLDDNGGAMVYTQATKPDGLIADGTAVETSPGNAVRRWMSDTFHRNVIIRSEDQERFGVWHVDYQLNGYKK